MSCCIRPLQSDKVSDWIIEHDVLKAKAINLRSTGQEPTTASLRKFVGKALEMLGFEERSIQRQRESGRSGTDRVRVLVLDRAEVLERGLEVEGLRGKMAA